jgi:hypothetical protein
MSTALQLRRGTTAQHATFTGALGEVSVDTDKDVVVVHDGSTAGGFPGVGLGAAQTFTKAQRGAIVALTDGATITPDFSLSNLYSVTLGGNRTLANPTNLVAGQSGSIFITQDGTGSRTLAYGSFWDFIGGTAPTLTTAAGAIDRIDYVVRTTGSIHSVFTANYS